jgi:hypothetical protein
MILLKISYSSSLVISSKISAAENKNSPASKNSPESAMSLAKFIESSLSSEINSIFFLSSSRISISNSEFLSLFRNSV